MEILVEQTDPKTGRTVYQYIDHAGKKGRIISRKQHLLDLRQQGKLVDFKIEEICFSSKRKRSSSFAEPAAALEEGEGGRVGLTGRKEEDTGFMKDCHSDSTGQIMDKEEHKQAKEICKDGVKNLGEQAEEVIHTGVDRNSEEVPCVKDDRLVEEVSSATLVVVRLEKKGQGVDKEKEILIGRKIVRNAGAAEVRAAFDMKDGEVTIEDIADSEAAGEEAALANWAYQLFQKEKKTSPSIGQVEKVNSVG